MENIAFFDIFASVKNLLYLGNYEEALTENESTDINEEDPVQVIRKKFYQFIAYLEEDKQNELNELLLELKDSKDSTKIYYNIFRVFLVYYIKRSYREELLTKIYNDLINLESVSQFLQPAIYLISLILLDLDDRERFLLLTKLMENDPEILMLRLFYFLKMNNSKEIAEIIELLNSKDSDSVSTTMSNVIVNLYNGNDLDKTLSMLAEIKQNHKMTPKLFSTIAVAMMFNGKFKEAVKPLNIGLEACTKSGTSNYDLNVILVNLICCYRNLGLPSELKDTEDKLRNYDPNNKYFARLKQFEEEFEK